jgi:hypothetical protein
MGSVTNNSTGSDWIPDSFAMEIITAHGYNYNERYNSQLNKDWVILLHLLLKLL